METWRLGPAPPVRALGTQAYTASISAWCGLFPPTTSSLLHCFPNSLTWCVHHKGSLTDFHLQTGSWLKKHPGTVEVPGRAQVTGFHTRIEEAWESASGTIWYTQGSHTLTQWVQRWTTGQAVKTSRMHLPRSPMPKNTVVLIPPFYNWYTVLFCNQNTFTNYAHPCLQLLHLQSHPVSVENILFSVQSIWTNSKIW